MSLVLLPSTSDAFTTYKPSKNAHTDTLSGAVKGGVLGGDVQASGARVIKLLPKRPRITPDAPSQLSILLDSIEPILSGHPAFKPYHALSDLCRVLTLAPQSRGAAIYARVKEELAKSVSLLERKWRSSIMSREEGWLSRLVDGWSEWEKRVDLLSSVFVYLQAAYIRDEGVSSIHECAISAFRSGIWGNELLFEKTRNEVLAWAEEERESGRIDEAARVTIQAVTALAKKLGVFDSLEVPYVELADTYNDNAASHRVDQVKAGSLNAVTCVRWALDKITEEESRARICLSDDVGATVRARLENSFAGHMIDDIVEKGLVEAMDAAENESLQVVYTLATSIGGFKPFVTALQAYIEGIFQARLKKLISDPANDPKMIDGTLTLKRFADGAVKTLFPTDTDVDVVVDTKEKGIARRRPSGRSGEQIELEQAVRDGFRAGMGSRQNAPAEWLAKHLDLVMRRGQGSGTEAEFDRLLDEIIALIGFTKDKDVFKAFYSTSLAKRLLLSKSASDDMERNMILKLQKEMGEEFTSGDIMMKDLQLSETLVKAYQTARARNPEEYKDTSNLTANVLTESAWPSYPLLKDGWNFQLPPELQASVDAFTAWYSTQHKNRKLSWRHQLGSVTLAGRFDSGRYEIGVSLFQAVVMLQFDEADVLDFTELKDRTGIESSELVRTLQSLAMGRKGTRVLIKRPPGKEVEPTDKFAFNKTFSSERIKFKINQIQQDLSAEETRQTNEQIAVDRVSVLEATIVRLMKGRKTLTLQLLIDAVVTDVSKRFPPDVKEIKKRVESLIEREFLMRDDDDRNLLHYLA